MDPLERIAEALEKQTVLLTEIRDAVAWVPHTHTLIDDLHTIQTQRYCDLMSGGSAYAGIKFNVTKKK